MQQPLCQWSTWHQLRALLQRQLGSSWMGASSCRSIIINAKTGLTISFVLLSESLPWCVQVFDSFVLNCWGAFSDHLKKGIDQYKTVKFVWHAKSVVKTTSAVHVLLLGLSLESIPAFEPACHKHGHLCSYCSGRSKCVILSGLVAVVGMPVAWMVIIWTLNKVQKTNLAKMTMIVCHIADRSKAPCNRECAIWGMNAYVHVYLQYIAYLSAHECRHNSLSVSAWV